MHNFRQRTHGSERGAERISGFQLRAGGKAAPVQRRAPPVPDCLLVLHRLPFVVLFYFIFFLFFLPVCLPSRLL